MLKRVFFLIFSVCVLAAQVSPQTPSAASPQAQSSASTQPKSITTLMKKTVGSLRVSYIREGTVMEADGTCFFVFYEDKRVGEKGGFAYLVTNRHMANPGIEDGNSFPVLSVQLRLNLANSDLGSEEGQIPIGGQLHWFYPSDDSVDLAVLPLAPDQARYDYMPIPVSLFATHDVIEAQGIAEGDSILFAGYFYQFPGLKKFQPIVREGILAMMPDEKLDTTLRKPGHLYLGDMHVFGGNSGSPLFVNLSGMRNGALSLGTRFMLLGVVSGFYHEDSNLNLTVATTLKGTLEQNSGIAMVVPVDELKTLLDSPALQTARDTYVSSLKPKN
jgi:hypothetical protein